MNNRELTKAELEIMQIVWKKNKVFLKDVMESFTVEPKPAYTTVSTIMRILVSKKFLAYDVFGKIYQYYPLITKEEYSYFAIKKMKSSFFEDSFSSMVSFFSKRENLSEEERNEIIKLLE